MNAYKCLEGRSQVDGSRLFSVVPNDRTGGNGNFRMNTRKNFFTVRCQSAGTGCPERL